MSNQQSSMCNTICCAILMIVFALISFSIRGHPKDLRLAEVNSFYQTNSSSYRTNSSQYQTNPPQATNSEPVLFNLTTFPIHSKYFQLLELLPLDKNDRQVDPCFLAKKENSLLLINLNTRTVGLQYFQLIKSLTQSTDINNREDSQKQCLNFRIYVLKQKKFLFFDYENTLNEYASEIAKTVQLIGSITSNKLTLVSSEEGSVMLMKSLINLVKQANFGTELGKKLNHVIMINLYNRKNFIQKEHVGTYLQKIKKSILEDRKILKVFNSLRLTMVNTLRQQYQLLNLLQRDSPNIPTTKPFDSQFNYYTDKSSQRFAQLSKISDNFFVFEKDKHFSFENPDLMNELQANGSQSLDSSQFKEISELTDQQFLALQRSHIIHSKEMFKIHAEFNDGDYFMHQPFLQLLSHFIKQSIDKQLAYKAIEYFFRYGQTNTKFPLQFMSQINYKECILYRLHFLCNLSLKIEPSLWNSNSKCLRLIVNSTFEQTAHIVYSDDGKFDVYSESLIKLSEHDKNIKKSVFLFEKLTHQLLVFNPHGHKISVATGKVFSPSHPLSKIFSEFQILYKDQIDLKYLYEDRTTKKFPVKACSNNLMIFPDDFPVGRYHRQSLLIHSDQKCYKQTSSYWGFMQKLFDNSILCKNLIILILFIDFLKKKPFVECMKITFICTMILVWQTDLRASHMVFVLFVVAMIENGLKVMCTLSSCIQIDRGRVFICMIVMLMSGWVCEKFLFQEYNYWKMVLIFVIFFINEENALVIGVKLYYSQDYIMNGEYDWVEIMQLVWFMRATQNVGVSNGKRQIWSARGFSKIGLVFSMALSMIFWPESGVYHTLITCYMKVKILFSSFKRLS